MTTRMKIKLLLDALAAHRAQTSHTRECCDKANAIAAELVELGMNASGSNVPAVVAPDAPRATAQSAPTAPQPEAKTVILATAPQVKYVSDLLESKNVAREWDARARDFLTAEVQSYAEATRLLNVLTQLPSKPRDLRPATPKQIRYARRLLAERDYRSPLAVPLEQMKHGQISPLIDALLAAPMAEEESDELPLGLVEAAAKQQRVAQEGVYRLGDTYYKVQLAVHGSGHPYVKRLDEESQSWGMCRTKGMMARLTPDFLITAEEAKRFGDLYGCCIRCCRTLTDEQSIADGIGPICKEKMGLG